MSDYGGDCAREGGLRYNSATFMADNLFVTFTNHVADLHKTCRSTMESYYSVRASMFAPGLSGPDVEAKAMELNSLVERLEVKGNAVEILLQQVDVNAVSQLIKAIPLYRDMTEVEARGIVVEYCEDVRMKFSWMRPELLATKRNSVSMTIKQVKQMTRVETR